ncbi:extracellular solute-binding protein [uncultured Cetobacterium sp.]|uniref:extracellular solute-binding protein n=1 Tax=uncultured Cetobacterium sp. TaxID=527638 RepID=UPI00262EF378|nr:extracellular solute-binding protein [uncultured Cetobacterium sp.]
MKKLLTLLSLVFLLASCGKEKQKNENTLYLYGWADYIPTKIYEDFEKETGIKVVEDIYSSNEEMFAKIKAGGTGYDILTPSTDYAEILMNDGMIEKLDKAKLPSLNNIDPMVLEKLQYFDKNNEYAFPFAMGATAIAVNTKYVKNFPKDFTIYNNSEYNGKMTLLDDMREVMTSALGTLGYPQTTTDEAHIAEAANLVKEWKKNIAKFDSESFGKGFASEDFWVVQCYPDNVLNELTEEQLKTTEFIIPEKGGTAYIDSFVIPKSAPNKEAAYKFLDFVQRPENYKLIADHLRIPSINIPARELMTTKPIYSVDDLEKTVILKDIKNTLDIQSKYWQQILID